MHQLGLEPKKWILWPVETRASKFFEIKDKIGPKNGEPGPGAAEKCPPSYHQKPIINWRSADLYSRYSAYVENRNLRNESWFLNFCIWMIWMIFVLAIYDLVYSENNMLGNKIGKTSEGSFFISDTSVSNNQIPNRKSFGETTRACPDDASSDGLNTNIKKYTVSKNY